MWKFTKLYRYLYLFTLHYTFSSMPHIKKLVLIISLLCISNINFAYNRFQPFSYRMSLQVTNPLSASSKYGGTLAYRFTQNSFMIGYTKYVGAYPGKQFKLEYQKYFRSNVMKNNHEWYAYAKFVSGDAGYESEKLAIIGEQTVVKYSPINYFGGGAGVGRRYNFGKFNFNLNLGLKYTPLSTDDIPTDQRDAYDMFYATGPGSVIDANVRFGYNF